MQKLSFFKGSIKRKVIFQITGQLVAVLLVITLLVAFLVNRQLSEQTEALLVNQSSALADKLEQRIAYLVENTQQLTTNELMVNALTDSEGRSAYLPPLIANFRKGKNVVALNVVDFDGRAIFQTDSTLPQFNESSQLRAALVLDQTAMFIRQQDKQLVIVSPISYYSTTQGAVIVAFDLTEIMQNHLPKNANSYIKLSTAEQELFSHNYLNNVAYRSHQPQIYTDLPLLKQLDLSFEVGLPMQQYNAPIKEAIVSLILLGLVFIAISVFAATHLANHITAPIIELYRRVKAADEQNDVLCSPLGSDDELEDLAKAFDERTLQLQYQTEHDSLTDLPNRVLYLDRLQQAVRLAERNGDKLAVFFIDLDRFKEVNDSFGHHVGDELLQTVGHAMEEALRVSDSIARIGGDEFTILLDRINSEEIAIKVLQKLMQRFKQPFVLEDYQFYLTCSVGVAIYPDNGSTPEELLKNADTAMYRAKEEGRNTYQFYTEDMTERAYERVLVENHLRQAIRNQNEFEVFYQPQVDMRTKQIIGMEPLIRWHSPELGFVLPYRFIPLAEESGMIVELDRWVMEQSMQQCMAWRREGLSPGKLSINLSMVQLNTVDFLDAVKNALFKTKMPAENVTFEVTETQVMRNPERAIVMLNQLKELGVSLAIDDFGTGFSSLAYLKRFPMDKIKIDRSFISELPEDQEDAVLTKAIISLADNLGMGVLAEGVETTEQAEFLMQNRCHFAQGYLYHKPLPAKDIKQLLVSQSSLAAHTATLC